MNRYTLFGLLLVLLVGLLSSCSIIETLTDEGPAPIISELTISPKTGAAPLLSTVHWNVVAIDNKPIPCELDFGDGTKETFESCFQLSDAFHTYEKPGGYIVVLNLDRGNREVSRSATVTVQGGSSQDTLSIAKFLVKPATGLAPLVTTLEWQIDSSLNAPVACDVNFGDGSSQSVENCTQVTFLFHTFEKPGGYVLTLKAHAEGQEAVSSFPVTVQAP
jgi:PKD repeat protein